MKKRILAQLFAGMVAMHIATPILANSTRDVATYTASMAAGSYLAYRGGKAAYNYIDNKVGHLTHYVNDKTLVKVSNTIGDGLSFASKAGLIAFLIYNHDHSAAMGNGIRNVTSSINSNIVMPLAKTGATLALEGIKRSLVATKNGVINNGVTVAKETALLPVNVATNLYYYPGYTISASLAGLYVANAIKQTINQKWNDTKKKVVEFANAATFPALVAGTCVAVSYAQQLRK